MRRNCRNSPPLLVSLHVINPLEKFLYFSLKTCGMLKKSKFILYSGFLLSRPSPASPCHAPSRSRLYATAQNHDELPFSWPSSSTFTPYDIIGVPRGAPYSKHRFYELVKIYHPDRPCNGHPLCKDITPEVRLQRYRIVVTAHEILSDPRRRAAYDSTGQGWAFNPVGRHRRTAPAGSAEYDPIFANATWEDWERWYSRNGRRQETVVDQRTFVTFVVLLFCFGAAVQTSWITQVSTGYEDRLKDINEQSTRFLNQRRENTVNQMAGSEAKVQHFLIRRDPSGHGLKGEEQRVYRDTLIPQKTSGQKASRAEQASQSQNGSPAEKKGEDYRKVEHGHDL
ncbi:hypothetical protein BDV18DRAFT_130678 [Aspergillus unguis]